MLTAPPIFTTSKILSSLISLKEILSPSKSVVFLKSFFSTSNIFIEKSSNLSINILSLKALELAPPEILIKSETTSSFLISKSANCLNPVTNSV